MILLFIFIAVVILAGIIGYAVSDSSWDRGGDGFMAAVAVGMIFGIPLLFLNLYGMAKNTTEKEVQYDIPIVSLQDGSQVEGSISGGLFVIQGTIGETQYFSYYKNNGNNTYSLEKREADRSVIVPDATPATAYVHVTDALKHCERTWWSFFCEADSGRFVHADFHVPANSIKNDFVLDAQ